MSDPNVTVYVVNYNYAAYLEKAIQSVLSQTHPSVEIIIIDDGSTDNSEEVLERFRGIKDLYIVYQKNSGLTAACNVALELARGRYVMRLDADDWLVDQAVEIMFAEMERNPSTVLVFPDYYIVDPDGEISSLVRRDAHPEDVALLDRPAHGACTLIKKEYLDEIGGYDVEINRQDGYDLWLKTIRHKEIRNVNVPLFFYRRHGSNLTTDEIGLFRARAELKKKHVDRLGLGNGEITAFIPVRGPALDPRSQPLRELGNKRLIDWTIECALDAERVGQVVISTPDNSVVAYVTKRYGKRVILHQRPGELAVINKSITASVTDWWISVGRDGVKSMGGVVLLYLEYPFRASFYIDKAVHTAELFDTNEVESIRRDSDIFYIHGREGLVPWHSSPTLRLERNELYRRTGGIHFLRPDRITQPNEEGAIRRVSHIEVDEKSSLAVRGALDWRIAELLARSTDNC